MDTLTTILSRLGLEHLEDKFRTNGIDDSILGELTDENLVAIGVNTMGDRLRILSEIRKLNSGAKQEVARSAPTTTREDLLHQRAQRDPHHVPSGNIREKDTGSGKYQQCGCVEGATTKWHAHASWGRHFGSIHYVRRCRSCRQCSRRILDVVRPTPLWHHGPDSGCGSPHLSGPGKAHFLVSDRRCRHKSAHPRLQRPGLYRADRRGPQRCHRPQAVVNALRHAQRRLHGPARS